MNISTAPTGRKIAVRGAQHAIPALTPGGGPAKLLLWTSQNDVKEVVLSDRISGDISHETAIEFSGPDTIVLASAGIGIGPVKVTEYRLNPDSTASKLDEFFFGLRKSYFASSCRLASGGVVLAFVQKASFNFGDPLTNTIEIDTCYKSPDGQWRIQTFALPYRTNNGYPTFLYAIEAADGVLNLFSVRDSHGSLGLTRFEVTPTGLSVISHSSDFISGIEGPFSVSTEFPYLSFTRRGDKILFVTQSGDQRVPGCPEFPVDALSSTISLIEIGTDLTVDLVGLLNWPSMHEAGGTPLMSAWPGAAGEYYFLVPFMLECKTGWRHGKVSNGKIIIFREMGGVVLSRSEDGYVVFQEKTDHTGVRTLDYYRADVNSVLTILPADPNPGGQVKELIITWTNPRPGQQLQESYDFVTWRDVPGATVPPVTVKNKYRQQFFRLSGGQFIT